MAFEDVKAKQKRKTLANGGGSFTLTPYFGSDADPEQPHAHFSQPDPGLVSSTHFHRLDQFQVVVGGKGSIGRHQLSPYCVHFSRAYTPYGPLVSDPQEGLEFIAMRAHYDAGSQRFPQERQQLERVANRRPWQITRQVIFPERTDAEVGLHTVPDISDEKGLAVYALTLKPGMRMTAPDPRHGDGQYLVVVKGSVILDAGQEKRALALVFSTPADGLLHVQAGKDGLQAIILNFPRPDAVIAAEKA